MNEMETRILSLVLIMSSNDAVLFNLQELALIKFHKTNASESVAMTSWLPSILPDGSQSVWQPRVPDQCMDRAVELGRFDKLIRLSNKTENPLDYKVRTNGRLPLPPSNS
jgi:hypothetical protein